MTTFLHIDKTIAHKQYQTIDGYTGSFFIWKQALWKNFDKYSEKTSGEVALQDERHTHT